MACMEHVCVNPSCNWHRFDNLARWLGPCPRCGRQDIVSTWDEADTYDREDGFEADEYRLDNDLDGDEDRG